MKVCLLIILFLYVPLCAQSWQELFLRANTCYSNKDYDEALHLYEQIPNKGAATWYNMGNCAYKKGDNLHALLYWKKAEQYGNTTLAADSRANSMVAAQSLSLPIDSQNAGQWIVNIIQKLVKIIPLLFIQILFFCMFGVLLVIICQALRRKRYYMLASCSMILLGISLLTYTTYIITTSTRALIMDTQAAMYTGPDKEYHQVTALPAGSQVKVLEKAEQWSKISWHTHVGWINNSMIEII